MKTYDTLRQKVTLLAAVAIFVVSLLSGVYAREVLACFDFTVRDAAFGEPRDVHRLCVAAEANDLAGREIYDRLESWFKQEGRGLNVELLRVAANGPGVRWQEYGVPSAPPSLPVAVLAGRRCGERRAFFIDYWEPGPSAGDLKVLKTSRAREAIRREVGRRLAVLLYVRGTGDEAGIAGDVLDAVVKSWSKKEPLGVSVVCVDRSDTRERLLLSFIGVDRTGPDWVAVVFGRGKLMPPLEGREITETRLNEFIEFLVDECTCLRSPSTLGVDIPMMWDETLDGAVVPLRSSDDGAGVNWDASLGTRMSGSTIERQILKSTIWTLAAFVLMVSIATVALVRCRNRTTIE